MSRGSGPHGFTKFRIDLLAAVGRLDREQNGRGPTGHEVKDKMASYYGEDIHHGRLYPNLDWLAEQGLIHKEPLDGRTNQYRLAPRGERELDSLASWYDVERPPGGCP